MSEKFTKAPWRLETVITSAGICHKIGPFPWKQGKQNYACIYVDYPGNGEVEAELLANAHLIAAAPDLYAAAKSLIEIDDADAKTDPDRAATDEYRAEVWTNLRAALAKARGES